MKNENNRFISKKSKWGRNAKEICPKCHKKSLFMTNSKKEVYCIRCNNLVAIKK